MSNLLEGVKVLDVSQVAAVPMEGVTDPIKLTGYPESVRMPAPGFSQHTEEILLEYGYSWEDITRLKEQGVIF